MTLESILYALLGIVAGLAVYTVFKALVKMTGRLVASASSHGSGKKTGKETG
jgi:hypothetical protein